MVTVRQGSRLLGALVVAGTLASCFSNKYQFVNNSTEGTFFKVPTGWKVYQLTTQDKEGRPKAVPANGEQVWHVGFDAAKQPDQAHLQEAHPTDLVGEVQIYALSSSANDQISQTRLRQVMFGVDPVLQDPGLPAKWEVVSHGSLAGPNGVVGSRTVINVPHEDAPDKFLTIDGSELLDPATGRAYFLVMRCEAQCYLDHRQAADAIATSWKVTK